jgi:raffinose/stachyose/melibiose transport system substrate-binding protein
MTYALDNKMDGEGMGLLNPGLQEVIIGTKTPKALLEEYEAWV